MEKCVLLGSNLYNVKRSIEIDYLAASCTKEGRYRKTLIMPNVVVSKYVHPAINHLMQVRSLKEQSIETTLPI